MLILKIVIISIVAIAIVYWNYTLCPVKQNNIPVSSPQTLFKYPDNTYMIVEGEEDNLDIYYTVLGVKEKFPELNHDINYLYIDKLEGERK